MIQSMKPVGNPLTVIAIFAALAEVAGTVVLAVVPPEIQGIFVWFVMLFPSLIVVLFFLTLNFKHTALYAPSDFRDDETFLQAVLGTNRLQKNIQQMERQLGAAQEAIAAEREKKAGAVAGEGGVLGEIIADYLSSIQTTLDSTKETAEDLNRITFDKLPNSAFQARIMHILRSKEGYVSVEEIAAKTRMGEAATRRSLEKLQQRQIVVPNDDLSRYRLAVV